MNILPRIQKRDELVDVLRGIAITTVLILHFHLSYPIFKNWNFNFLMHGNYGVTIFFVISGYLISSNALSRYGELSSINIKHFYYLRYARILPPLCLALIMIIFLSILDLKSFTNSVYIEGIDEGYKLVHDKNLTEFQRHKKSSRLIRSHLHLDWMAEYTLGRNRRMISAKKIAEFAKIYSQFVVKVYADLSNNYNDEKAVLKNVKQIDDDMFIVNMEIVRIISNLHYYPEQVRKFAEKWEQESSNVTLNDEEYRTAEEYLLHANLFAKAKDDKEKLEIIQKLGGVTICYRKNIKDSPAYRLNHEEIEHAIADGVKFIENVSPEKIDIDQFGSITSLNLSNNKKVTAKTILIAIGTNSNKFVDIDSLDDLESDIFKNESGNISYFGDCNQKYAGSVVKALASAKNGYKKISHTLEKTAPKFSKTPVFDSSCIINKITQLAQDITEITVHSKTCASNFRPGQFFRLQNRARSLQDTMEPIAITATEVDHTEDLLTFIIQNVGKSSNLARKFKENDNIVLMGPTGLPTKIVSNKNTLLIGGGIGNALLIPIAKKLRENGCNITFISGYKKHPDPIYAEKIEEVSDNIIRSFQQDPNNPKTIIDVLNDAKTNGLLDNIDHIYCNGSNIMMEAVLEHKDSLFPNIEITYSINSPMQCMMKGICGQCIQKTNDENGYRFSCTGQDFDAGSIDFECLNNRLSQSSLFEKM